MLPPAVGLFSSILKAHNHDVELFDSTNWIDPYEKYFDSDKSKEDHLNVRPFDDSKLRTNIHRGNVFDYFEKKTKIFSPDLIAVSATESIFSRGISLLRRIRHLKIPVIMGGVFPTFAPELALSYDEIDMVCIGEGEQALLELCDHMEKGLSCDDIKNIWIKKGDSIRKNPMRPLQNIDENPLPDFSLFEESRLYRPMQGKVWRMLPVETHRGCPNKCAYCNSPTQTDLYRRNTQERYFRKKSFDVLRKEIIYYRDIYKTEAFYFWADSFMTYTDKEFDDFIEMYSDIKIPFWCQLFPNSVKQERIKRAMKVGLFRIGSGIEHGNEEFRRKLLNRKVSNETMLENFKILNDCQIPFSVNNIIGFPTETRELAMETVELNRHIDADSANAYCFIPFHGTPLRRMTEELGYCKPSLITDAITKGSPLHMPHFPPEAIEGLQRCFVMYVKMPKSRWKDIEKAEKLTPEGNRIWEELKNECAEKYMKF